ncbi:MAG: nucleotidyltransferase domain-containing protein [Dictyoglomi bacterium]|jgi:hypothetical protein|nr:nucleotidyltransferase domain-containing protein [Dictyoglomota bacterium]
MQKRLSGSVRVFYPKLNREEVVELLLQKFKILEKKLPIIRVVLFGSYAKGNYTVGSDVDILVIYDGEKRNDDYAIVKKTLNIPRLEPHIYTKEEYEKIKDVLEKMTKDGILLFYKDLSFL